VIINDCLIAVGIDDVLECAASFIKWVRLASPIGSAAGASINLSTSLSNRWEASGKSQIYIGFLTPTAMGQ
jgi:hypothetical protein